MFNNLIESSSHAREIKRRGSFMLFTLATYLLLFVIGGVMSIYAYDASLSDPSTELELISLVPPVVDEIVPEPPKVPRTTAPTTGATPGRQSVRPVLIDHTNNPQNVPDTVSAVAAGVPPAHVGTVIGPVSIEPPGGGGSSGNNSTSTGGGQVLVATLPDPPPLPTPAPKRIVTATRVLNSQAISLPKPPYPSLAKQAGAQGAVNVQVLIDETGKVISAKAISGNPLLKTAAQQAAERARFSPTMLGDQAVKVSGVITYNFVLQ